jgi:RimJ/RimL family protein N-acetyltransferase
VRDDLSKRSILPFQNEQVRLRLLQAADLPLTLAWRNQDNIRKWFFHSDYIPPEQHATWYAQYAPRDDDFVFVIEAAAQHYRPVGQIALYHVDWAAQRAEFGRLLIGEQEATGRGLARAATALLVDTALQAWGLKEIYLEVYANNAAARAVYARCGFHEVGVHDNIVRMSRASLTGSNQAGEAFS